MPDSGNAVTKENISYFGALITDNGLESIQNFLQENGIETFPEQNNMHMTCEFYGFRPETDRASLPSNEDLGKTVSLTVCGYGTYDKNDGTILNQGLLIDRDSLKEIGLSDGRTLDDATRNDVAHITVAINPDRNENGRPVARAVDTAKCDFRPVDSFKVEAVIAAFEGNEPRFEVEGNDRDKVEDEKNDIENDKDDIMKIVDQAIDEYAHKADVGNTDQEQDDLDSSSEDQEEDLDHDDFEEDVESNGYDNGYDPVE